MIQTIQIHLLDLKTEMLRNEEYVIDFLENNFSVDYANPYLKINRVMLVEERYLARLDLISFDAYGDINSMDIIMKFNQISNPFSMALYDIIAIPDAESARQFYQKEKLSTVKSIKDTKALFIDPTRASQKDQARIKQLEALANKRENGSTEVKPTNLLRDGEIPFSTDGTALIFAPSISKPRFPPTR